MKYNVHLAIILIKSRKIQHLYYCIYDNNLSIVSGITCIAGFDIALVAMPSLNTALFICGMCCIIDDLGWIIVYNRNKKILQNIN